MSIETSRGRKAIPSTGATRATQATVVPAKAGIQEILREKYVPATEGSGFRLSPERRVYAAVDLSAHGNPVIRSW